MAQKNESNETTRDGWKKTTATAVTLDTGPTGASAYLGDSLQGESDSLVVASTGGETGSTLEPRRGGNQTPPTRSKTALAPRIASKLIKLHVLRIANRLRLIRALDIAIAVFPERDLRAALSAAHRATSRLSVPKGTRLRQPKLALESEKTQQPKRRLAAVRNEPASLVKYRSDAGQTYYGLTKAGAAWLRENGDLDDDGGAQASVSTVCSKTNPEHELWANTIALTCAARGIEAWNESELKSLLGWCPPDKRVFPITVDTERRVHIAEQNADGASHVSRVSAVVIKGLLPDVLATTKAGAVWIEIDKSGRGGDRRKDIENVIRHIGKSLKGVGEQLETSRLGRVVILCKKGNHFAGITKYLIDKIEDSNGRLTHRLLTLGNDLSGDRPRPMLVPVEGVPGCYGVYRYLPSSSGINHERWQYTRLGYLHIQMLPTWLPKFSYRGTTRTDGWLSENHMPWASQTGSWEPISPTLPT